MALEMLRKLRRKYQTLAGRYRPSITVKLQGGLGNQLFQWAYAKHLSNRYMSSLCLDLSFICSDLAHVTKRELALDKFPNMDIGSIKFVNVSELAQLNGDLNNSPIILNDDFSYDEYDFSDVCNYYLDGYWQSEKYFIGSEHAIRKELSPSEEIIDRLKSTQPIDTNTVSIHIRRTDYLASNGLHPVQPVSYYQKALDRIGDYEKVFVFARVSGSCSSVVNGRCWLGSVGAAFGRDSGVSGMPQ